MWIILAILEIPFALIGIILVLLFVADGILRLKRYFTATWQLLYRPNHTKQRGKDVKPWQNML